MIIKVKIKVKRLVFCENLMCTEAFRNVDAFTLINYFCSKAVVLLLFYLLFWCKFYDFCLNFYFRTRP